MSLPIPFHIPTDVLHRLIDRTGEGWFGPKTEALVCRLIREWMAAGTPTTPSRLANASGCGTRNAWRAVWLRFPGDRAWKLAAACRADE